MSAERSPVAFAPFEPSDGWLLQALLYAGGLTDGAELADVIGLGDGSRDAIFTPDELRGGFARLTAAGYVRGEAGLYFVVGEARSLAKREGLSLAEHATEIEAFLAASNYRGSDDGAVDPELSDERIRAAVRAYLERFDSEPAEPPSPPESPTVH